ncbi:inositol 5-phosphatase [Cordyceps militaris CM01]|uniref:Inositol 5-phosphatase n=2 Tax=Cordyceps militaris TaxID=73501 RepID=G3JAB1_CORMM|nr:inositol 5-phosphatase [Cordyceps militaris CM01]ATY61107.1 inositol 5-phosphatase [Cordyceps militaris]EGX95079.1 inositol 5-phosphatase [Cordyceps militaris CM01]
MTPSTVDLLFLTFNCAKALINTPVFANHLEAAFGQNATDLPDLIVLSLQEVAPLSYAFIGDYFLRPYIERFDTAINQAASQHVLKHEVPDLVSATERATQRKRYELMKSKNVGYTAILLFAKDSSRIRDIKESEVGFGAADMGNKGAVGLRTVYDAGESGSAELTFVATHLAAMEWNLPRRNANWASIMRCMTFGDPLPLLELMRSGSPPPSDGGTQEEGAGLLQGERNLPDFDMLQKQLQELSLFKPTSHLFVGGDLNYRISTSSPPPNAAFPSLDAGSDNYYPRFFDLDQLTREKAAGRTMHGLTEAPVHFPPTYKYDVLETDGKDGDTMDPVPWRFAPHRYPSWTDRILYMDLPSWVAPEQGRSIKVHAYDALPLMRTSDHRPVFLRIEAPMLSLSDLTPTTESLATSTDPRVRLPTELDPEAWERRAAARRRELLLGWSMFLWSTKEGACILATFLVASLSAYWVYRSA